jgi:hypothetical protein
MPRVKFEATIPGFEQAKTVHALDRTVTAIGRQKYAEQKNQLPFSFQERCETERLLTETTRRHSVPDPD